MQLFLSAYLQFCIMSNGAAIDQLVECPTENPSATLTRVWDPCAARDLSPGVNFQCKLQALVYDILPSITALFSYAIGYRKLSANEQFFVGTQTIISLLHTTQIKQGVSFIAANKVYTSTDKTTIVWIETNSFFLFSSFLSLTRMDASHVYVRALAPVILVPEPFGGRWPRRWTAARR